MAEEDTVTLVLTVPERNFLENALFVFRAGAEDLWDTDIKAAWEVLISKVLAARPR